jgi:alpha-tubulin suppressor-like RCC1 family protein
LSFRYYIYFILIYLFINCKGVEISKTKNDDKKILEIEKLSDKKIVDVSCGELHVLAISKDGSVYGWGRNTFGQINFFENDSKFITLPTLVYKFKI